MTGPLRHRAAADDLPPVRPLGPTPGTGTGSRPGPDYAPIFPAQHLTVAALDCGHIAGDVCDDECAYWSLVATGELPGPDAYLVDGVHTIPPHVPGLVALVDPALRRAA